MTDARAQYHLSISEADFEKQVVDLAHLFRWQVVGFRPARVTRNGRETYETPVKFDGRGFCDLVLVRPQDHRPGRVVFAEIKSMKGRLSLEQEVWIEALKKANAEVYVWKPSDWPQIEEVLK